MSNFLTALGLGQPSWSLSPATQSRAGLSERKTNQTYLRDGEKLWGTADSPAKRREDASSKKFPKPAGRMLSFPAAEASSGAARWRTRGRGSGRLRGGRGTTSRWPGRRTHRHPGGQVRGSPRSCKGVDELPARIRAAVLLWAGCWYETPQVESLGREVIRNSCTSRWFILT